MTNAHIVKTDRSPTCSLCFDTTCLTFFWTWREQALPMPMTATWFLGLTINQNAVSFYDPQEYLPKRKHNIFRTRRKFEIKNVTVVVFISPINSWCVHTCVHTLANDFQLLSQFEPNSMQKCNSFK